MLRLPGFYKRKVANPDGTMSLLEHIKELRYRILMSFLAVVLCSVIGFFWYSQGFSLQIGNAKLNLATLGDLLKHPYCALSPEYRAQVTFHNECRLFATGILDQFMLRLKIAVTVGIILSSPIWFYQSWRFITPGLHNKEKKYAIIFVFLSSMLFFLGAILAYLVVTKTLSFLLSIGSDVQVTGLSGNDYFNFIVMLIIIFGVSFELPLVVILLNIFRILKYKTLKQYRRIIFFIIVVFSGIVTPGQDPFTMLALAFALIILIELSIQFTRIHDKRILNK